MKNHIPLIVAVVVIAALVLFAWVYSARAKDKMSRKRSLAIGIFTTLVMNSFFYSYLSKDGIQFTPVYAVLGLEFLELVLFASGWRIFRVVRKSRQQFSSKKKEQYKRKEESVNC